MNESIDTVLEHSKAPMPRREISAGFTNEIVSKITAHPVQQNIWMRTMEKIRMNITKPAVVFGALAFIVVTSGVTYAAFNNPSLRQMLNLDPLTTPQQSLQAVKEYYTAYAKNADTPTAYGTFSQHISKELKQKLDTQRSQPGYDPVLCSNNTPSHVSFTDEDMAGNLKAQNHYDTDTVTVGITFSSSQALITDIVCPVAPTATAAATVKGYINDYVQGKTDAESVKSHLSPEMQKKFEEATGFNAITCSQDLPAMVDFSNETATGFTANYHFYSDTVSAKVSFDPKTKLITDIECM